MISWLAHCALAGKGHTNALGWDCRLEALALKMASFYLMDYLLSF